MATATNNAASVYFVPGGIGLFFLVKGRRMGESTLEVPEGSQSQEVFPHTLGQLGIIRPCVLIFLSEAVTSHSLIWIDGLIVAEIVLSKWYPECGRTGGGKRGEE